LLGGNCEIGDHTESVARQWSANNRGMMFPARSAKQQLNSSRGTVFSVRSVPRCYTQDDQWELISGVTWLVSEWVRVLLWFSPCELLLWEAGSWSMGTVQEPWGWGMSAIRSHYQVTDEDTAERKCSALQSVN
jgi:hypothetical protein